MLMTKALLRPFINRFTGEIKIMSKKDGKQLSEDWAVGKTVKNKQGEKVFRFHLSAPVTGRDGKVHMGTAIVDLTETETPAEELEAVNEQPDTK